MRVIVKNFYRKQNARECVDYITRYNEKLYDRNGEEMDHAEEKDFVNKTRDYDYHHHIIISPEEKLSTEELKEYTNNYVDAWLLESNRQYTTDYCYSIHDTIKHPHAHVVLSGDPHELKINREEAGQMHELAREYYLEPEKNISLEQGLIKEEEKTKTLELEQEHGLEMGGMV